MARLFSLDSNFVFIGFDIEFVGDKSSSGKILINLDGTFNASWDIKNGDTIQISDDAGFIKLDREFSTSESDIEIIDLVDEYQKQLKIIDYLNDFTKFNDFVCLKLIERLFELSKIDSLALIPLKSCLNKLDKLTNKAQNEFEFSMLLDNVRNKIHIARENQLFGVEGLKLDEAIEYEDLNKLKIFMLN